MEGLYELQQAPTGEQVKVFESQFEPPEDSDKVQVLRFAECTPDLFLITDSEDVPILQSSGISLEDFNGLITVINQKTSSFRNKLTLQSKILIGYIVVGLLALGTVAVLLGVYVTYWISLVVIVVYFILLVVIQRVTSKQ